MNLREAIAAEESLRAEWVDWRLRVRGSADDRLLAKLRQASAVREAYLRMAEAALEHAEYQVRVHSYAPVDSATYIRERTELWDAYMEARAKAKAISQQ